MKKLIATVVAATLVLSATGCGQPLFPTLSKIEQTVVTDLENGASDSQIASDVCADLGGTAATDAVCAGAATIIADTIQLLLDAGVLSAKAQARAQAYKAAHPKPAAAQ